MKKLSTSHVIIILLISLFNFNLSFSQDCDECPEPKIVYYDCDVIPETDDDLPRYVFLWPFAVAIQNIINGSPSCITWGAVASANVENLLTGFPNKVDRVLMTAPSGGVNNWDYLIHSTVDTYGDSYIFVFYLETALTRESLWIRTAQFPPDLESAQKAGLAIATELGSILEEIRYFEKNKRDSDTRYAIGNLLSQGEREITITPQKTVVNAGETIDVNIKLVDCDGVALGNRSLSFEFGGGKITPEEATTNESGFVTVQFIAGSDPGPGEIIVRYPHLTPCGHQTYFYEAAIIQIEPPADNLFILRGSVNYRYSMNSDTTINIDIPEHSWEQYYSAFAVEEANGRVTALIENYAEDPSKDFYYSTDIDPLALIVSGSGMNNQFGKYEEIMDGKLLDADTRTDNVSGSVITRSSIYFNYSDDDKSAEVGVNIKATGQYTGLQYDPLDGWSDYGGDYDDYGLLAIAGASAANGCNITRSDSTRYNANYSFSESYEVANLNGTRHITKNRSMTLSVAPYDAITGISDDEHVQLFPKEFSLSQNYPNPFNPITNITYQLKYREMVKLKVYDVLGNEIAILADGIYPQGTYTVQWDASGISSGVYFYKLQIGTENSFIQTKKMIVLK